MPPAGRPARAPAGAFRVYCGAREPEPARLSMTPPGLPRSFPLVVAAFLFAGAWSAAQAAREKVDPGQEIHYDPSLEVPWKEEAVTALPAYPADTDLLAVALPKDAPGRLYVDPRSLSVGTDGVIRLILVIETRGGTRNVFYDGIRCQTREHKTYAVGTPERSLTGLKDPRWQPIRSYGAGMIRHVLQHDYLCDPGARRSSARELVDRLRYPVTNPP
jgi:hypothetical protein